VFLDLLNFAETESKPRKFLTRFLRSNQINK